MSLRRNTLLSILANNGKWLPYSFEYLYHDLIPTTIDSKQVKNKLKLATIYGNSVVENQLCDFDTFLCSEGTITDYTDYCEWTPTANASAPYTNRLQFYCRNQLNFISGHTYLAIFEAKKTSTSTNVVASTLYGGGIAYGQQSSISLTTNYGKYCTFVVASSNSSTSYLQFLCDTRNISTIDFKILVKKNVQLIDLTQRYPFDTPTTLTDNRVQAILNRGYIPYNSGELKSVDIGEFSSDPYNLFDGEWEIGNWDNPNATTNCKFKNFIEVICGKEYEIEFQVSTNIYVREYDTNKNLLRSLAATYGSKTKTFTVSNDASYIKIMIYDANINYTNNFPKNTCLHRTGTRTGYAPHTQPQTISLKYQGGGVGTSHNSMTIYNDRVEFTTDRALVDLGSLSSWEYNTSWVCWRANEIMSLVAKPQATTDVANIICNNYPPIAQSSRGTTNSIFIFTDGRIGVVNGSTTTQPTGTLEYQLATPQVITIPRKHLGVVDLGSFNWTYNSSIGFYATISDMKTGTSTAGISSTYLARYWRHNISAGSLSDREYVCGSTFVGGNSIVIKDTSYSNAEAFKSAMSGQYLFYETQDEVADILDTIGVESGGTFTANWFSWVENQLLSNGNFSNGTTGWSTINGTASVSNNVLTQTLTAIGSHKYGNGLNVGNFEPPLNHKYLCVGYVKPKYNGTCYIGCGYTENISSDISITANQWNKIVAIITNTTNSGANNRFTLAVDCTSNYQVGDTIEYKELECIDITQAFGSGNEPTSISDPRIQKILEIGYIPTNTTGTQKSVDCEVLPNVDTKIKAK